MMVFVCVFVLMARDRSMDRSPDTDQQQVKAIFWHLPVAAGLFVNELSRASLCVFSQKRQGKSVWPGLFFCFYGQVYGTKQKDHREICVSAKSLGVVGFVWPCAFTVPITGKTSN